MSVIGIVFEFKSAAKGALPRGAEENAPVALIPVVQPQERSGDIEPDKGEDSPPAV